MATDTEELFATGDAILEAARQRGVLLEGGGPDDLVHAGWSVDHVADNGTTFVASRQDGSTQSYAFMSAHEYPGPPMHLYALVRDFDVGKLAGELRECKTHAASACTLRVEYTSVLPWPFEPRWILAVMRFGVLRATGALVVLGESVPGAAPPPGSRQTLGTCHYSFYHITPGGSKGGCVLRRCINIDMHMALPHFVVRRALASHYVRDMAQIEAQLAAWEGCELQKRLAGGSVYRAMEAALATAKR